MSANLAGLDPRTLRALQELQRQASAAGIRTNVLSGFRSPEDQRELFANYRAGQAGQPLPFPARGAVPLAAAPGTSLHEKGLAFDLAAADPSQQSQLWSLGKGLGLKAIGLRDPSHFELADASSSAPAGPTVAASRGITDLIANVESGNRNIIQNIHDTNTDKGTPAGGYFQIIDPTWQRYAKIAGVDTDQYGYAMAAPRDVQAKVAAAIPLNQWGPNTQKAILAKYPGLDLNQTLGAAEGGAGGASAAVASNGPNTSDWQALLGAEAPPAGMDLGGLMSSAAAAGVAPPAQPRSPIVETTEPAPPLDLNFATASDSPDSLSQRYAQNKDARKLTPLGSLFTLKTIGQPGGFKVPPSGLT